MLLSVIAVRDKLSGGVELRHLATFVAVAEEASFTRAADRLHVVQSAVSAGVRNLEKELGTMLFDRSTRRVKLTDSGRALLPEARATLAAAQAARDAVDEARGGLRGTVVLGTMQAQGMRAIDLAGVLAAFRAGHPGVEVKLRHSGGSTEMAREVREGSLDLAFVALPGAAPPGLELIPLAREPIVLADRLGTRRLVDADRPDRAVRLRQRIATDPADIARHLLVAHLGRAPRGLLEVGARGPSAAANNCVQLHCFLLRPGHFGQPTRVQSVDVDLVWRSIVSSIARVAALSRRLAGIAIAV